MYTLNLTKEELIAINSLLQTKAKIDWATAYESAYDKTWSLLNK